MILSKPNHIKIYGHRGARGDLPENTLESFKYLFDNNINAYETDILITKDLTPVITHDFRLDPSFTKDEDGNWIKDENIKIFDLTYEEISKFDVGSLNKLTRYGRRFVNQKSLENQKIPKLSELLDLSSKNISENLLINLENPEKILLLNEKNLISEKINEKSNYNSKISGVNSDFTFVSEFSEVNKAKKQLKNKFIDNCLQKFLLSRFEKYHESHTLVDRIIHKSSIQQAFYSLKFGKYIMIESQKAQSIIVANQSGG